MLVQIAQPNPQLALNQRIRVLGLLERPGPAMNPGQFDWASYYREQRILTSLHVNSARNIAIVGTTRMGPFDYLRQRSRGLLAEGFAADRSLDHALLRALLLGDTDPELRDIQEQFRKTGTSHQLAVSGMHVAVLGAVIYGICRLLRLRPRWAVLIGLSVTLLYGAVALPHPPIVRSVLLVPWPSVVGILPHVSMRAASASGAQRFGDAHLSSDGSLQRRLSTRLWHGVLADHFRSSVHPVDASDARRRAV